MRRLGLDFLYKRGSTVSTRRRIFIHVALHVVRGSNDIDLLRKDSVRNFVFR